MSKTNDNNQPVAVGSKQPQAAPPTNEVFIRVGTTLYKVVDQPNISGGKVRKRIPWNMETCVRTTARSSSSTFTSMTASVPFQNM